MDVVLVIILCVGLLVAFVVWANGDDDRPAPVIAADGRCPLCSHLTRDHGRTQRRGVREGCEVPGCTCTVALRGRYR